ncbi:energy transducer TonB [Piscinibacter sakaiensis]|uniref:TonB C-terminal domain-containing protein n=1 Tax=Piscinibacter sakaiensis TaxID=1547922 RepID=A0A0K8P7E2_PISS1|nr:energy transducer TonB [Piscinibacter sakaiensis]GAP38546.1 hypothetical protein ISF6_5004 [Piscinibacter sakaiensis]
MKLPLTCTILALLLALAGCATSSRTSYTVGHGPEERSPYWASVRMARSVAALPPGEDLDVPLKLLESPMPQYPSGGAEAGVVVVQYIIESDGRVSTLRVLGDAPFILGYATRLAVEKWRYAPITKGGQPTRIEVEQEFVFHSPRQ